MSLKQNLTTAPNSALPDKLLNSTALDAGLGVSSTPDDQLLPLIYVLQTNSPGCDKRAPEYIDGAEPGHFLLRNAAQPIRAGETGIEVIPCDMARMWIEWRANRQGFVASHREPPDDLEITIDGASQRQRQVRPNGNVVEETRQFFVLADDAIPASENRRVIAELRA
jgi:hypothetical protein